MKVVMLSVVAPGIEVMFVQKQAITHMGNIVNPAMYQAKYVGAQCLK
jgi:hypothetical protein